MSKPKGSSNKYLRVFLLAIALIGLVYLIAQHIGVFGNVLLVLLGFGTVVLVHEFGHFITAKSSGIKVEAFSIFMPPILFGVRRTEDGFRFRILPEVFPARDDESGDGSLSFTVGRKGKESETEYRIGLIPFGGFVKMLGQDDIGSVKSNDDPRSFANKPVHTRAAVLASGVVFNVISAVIIFMVAFLIGIKLPPAIIGGVMRDGPADRADLKAGDEVVEIAGKNKDLDFSNIAIAAALSGRDEKITMTVRHRDGSVENMVLVAEQIPGEPMRSFGIVQPSSLTVGRLSPSDASDANDLYSKTGLLGGDRIESVDGKPVATYWELRDIIADALVPEVTLSAERIGDDGKAKLIESRVRLNWSYADSYDVESESELSHIYSMVPQLRITALSDDQDSPVNKTEPSLLGGDIILAIGEVENPTYKQMRDVTTEYEDRELAVKVLRTSDEGAEQTVTVTVVPSRAGGGDRVMIGIGVALDAEHPVVARTIATEGGTPKLDIPSGASITAVDGVPVSNFYDIVRQIRRYDNERITIDWRLDAETAGNVALNVDAGKESITVKSAFTELIPFEDLRTIYKAGGPVGAVVMGYRRTVMFIAQTYVTLRRLVGGLVSPKSLMGPVGIITFSYRIVSEQPLIYYVYFLGLISAVIAVFNFLPLPPLDGGLVLLMIVEKVKGSALSERVQTIIAYAGWTFILTLILYVTFNDIVRSFFS